MPDLILGVSAYYHDSAAALISDGVVVAAAQEERFSRRRHDPRFPEHAVMHCLRWAGVNLSDVAVIAYFEDPAVKFRRVLATWLGATPTGFQAFRESAPQWLVWKRNATRDVRRRLQYLFGSSVPKIIVGDHHESHAASAFFPSPYDSAAVLCIDAVGEWDTTTIWHGRDTTINRIAELRFPHSLGLLYSAFTYYCGFKVNSGEYKLMGLAPYGTPQYESLIRSNLIDIKPDGSFRLNLKYFTFQNGPLIIGRRFEELFGGPRRKPEDPLTQREFDLAASIQHVTEDVVFRLARTARKFTGERRLCLAGGVALNCAANGHVVQSGIFDELWVQPAAGDAGGALGAALVAAHKGGAPRTHLTLGGDGMNGSLLGPAYSNEEIGNYLRQRQIPHELLGKVELEQRVAEGLASGKVIGWFQGRMEFGPRALGARSILADARVPSMQSELNLKIKFRESFRPFAPVVLAEDAADYFDLHQESPYMTIIASVAENQRLVIEDLESLSGLDLLNARRSTIPAATHIDMSARIQTVDSTRNPRFRDLLVAFKQITGCPVLLNTSFNVRGEPIVNTLDDAYACFMRTSMDFLAIGDFLLDKSVQPQWCEEVDWRGTIPLD